VLSIPFQSHEHEDGVLNREPLIYLDLRILTQCLSSFATKDQPSFVISTLLVSEDRRKQFT
jgi:hypothetical protein